MFVADLGDGGGSGEVQPLGVAAGVVVTQCHVGIAAPRGHTHTGDSWGGGGVRREGGRGGEGEEIKTHNYHLTLQTATYASLV